MMHRSVLKASALAVCLLSVACNTKAIDDLKSKVSNLEAEVKKLNDEPSLKSKVAPAFLSPADTGYDFASDNNGMLYAVSVENVEAFPGGVKYIVGVTNIYAIGMNGVELNFNLGGQSKKIEIPETIQPGKRIITPVSFIIENNQYPKYLLVNVSSKGMRFNKQF
jgi:outer membrane murein-binding lipoprotein Lpp